MENQETTTLNVVVHKANIPMASGESLDKFISKLADATRAHATTKFLLNREKGDFTWMVEAFSDSVIASVSKDKQPRRMFAMSFTRDPKTMAFKFGDPVEVERKTSFVAVNATTPTISTAKAKAPEEDEQKGPAKDYPTLKAVEQHDRSQGALTTFGNEKSQWVQKTSSFWAGAL